MLRLLHDKDLPEAFNVTTDERHMLIELIKELIRTRKKTSTTWIVERLWIDERFSDNLRAMAIFLLGYTYAYEHRKEGYNDGGDSIDGLKT